MTKFEKWGVRTISSVGVYAVMGLVIPHWGPLTWGDLALMAGLQLLFTLMGD